MVDVQPRSFEPTKDESRDARILCFRAEPGEEGLRLDQLLALRQSLGRRVGARLVAAARVNGRRVAKGYRVASGDEISVALPSEDLALPEASAEDAAGLVVVRATESVLVLDKPAGLASVAIAGQAGATLASRVAARFAECRGVGRPGEAGLAHRLDADTSGLVLAARGAAAYDELRRQFRAHTIEKTYLAVVWGRLERSVVVDVPIAQHRKSRRRMRATPGDVPAERYRAQPASSRLELAEALGELSLVRVYTSTGARHQVRVHAAHAGFPLAGDTLYGGAPHPALTRHLLHASEIRWMDPTSGAPQHDTLPPPSEWAEILARLRGD